MERGYKSVTLRDIAGAVGIKHASLYHHAPGGKEQLFVEVTELNLARHQAGLTSAMQSAGQDVRLALYAAAGWLMSQPPMDLLRMTLSDIPEIAPAHAMRLARLTQQSLLEPVTRMLTAAQARGEIGALDCGVVAGGFITMIEGLHAVPAIAFEGPHSNWRGRTRLDMARYLIDVLLAGLSPRVSS